MATRPLVDKTTPAPPPVADRLQLAEELLDLAERAQAHTRAAGSAIALKLGEKLYVRTSTGVAPEVGSSLAIGEGAIGQCARSGKPCNVSEDSKIDVSLRALGIRSLIAIPIHHAGIFYGVLVALGQAPEAFTRMQVAIMMTMGNEVARVLKRMEAAAVEIAPGTPMRSASAPAPAAVPEDNVVEISLSPAAKQDIVETIKTIEQRPAPAAMKLRIDTPVAAKPSSVVAPKPTEHPTATAPVLTAAQVAASAPLVVEQPKPLPDLLPPGEDPRRYGTLKTAKSLQPKPTFVAANAFAQPRQTSSMKPPLIAAAVVLIALAGFAMFRRGKSSETPHTTAASEPAAAPVAVPVSTPAPQVAQAADSTPAPVLTAKTEPVTKSEPAKKQVEAKTEESKPVAEQAALHIATTNHTDMPQAVEAPRLALASNASMPDLGTPKVPAASLQLRHTTAVPAAILRQVPPVYPEIARHAGVYGTVRLQVTVSTTGTASSVHVLDGPPILRPAATSAVSRWQFRAATLDGKAVESTMEVLVKFAQP